MISRADFAALSSAGLTRAWDGLGGSHTFVTYPPLDALRPLPSEPVLRNMATIESLSLYVHLPFCEMSCPFCPYERHVIAQGDAIVDSYIRALILEMNGLAENLRQARVQSLYIGGGTATVLTENQMELLLTRLREAFRFSSDSVVCVETSPNALIENPSKIGHLEGLGVKRVSVGVQTLSNTALRSEGRTHDPVRTLEMLQALIERIEVVNVDLMQDMPGQTDDDIENDLGRIAALRPAQLTSYVERLRKWQGAFPDSYRSVVRRLRLRDRLIELGYTPRPGGRFIHLGCADDPFKSVRCGLDSHLIGLGASAYGHVPGYFYRNTAATAEYMDVVFRGESAIADGLLLQRVDIVAASLASGIRSGVQLRPEADREVGGYIREVERTLEFLTRHRLVRFDPEHNKYEITLDGLGWAYEEEICSLFVPGNLVRYIREANRPWWPATSMTARHS